MISRPLGVANRVAPHRSRRLPAACFLLLTVLALAGCGGAEGSSSSTPLPAQADVQTLHIVAKDNVFDPSSYTLEANKPVQIILSNSGSNVHAIEVKDLVPETKLTPGQSKTVNLPTVKAGTFRVYCEIHEDEKMEGELTVK